MARLLLQAALALAPGAHGAMAGRSLAEANSFDPSTDPYTMFVQLAGSAKLEAKEQGTNVFTLALDGTTPLIFTFKDRPDRETSVVPLGEFLKNFPMQPNNPPNAAITATIAGDNGTERVVAILTIASPQYDEGNSTVTYSDVTLLDSFEDFRLLHKVAGQEGLKVLTTDDIPAIEALELVSLFIDDCTDYVPKCYDESDFYHCCSNRLPGNNLGVLPTMAMCWLGPPCSYCSPCCPQNGCSASYLSNDDCACYNSLISMCNVEMNSCTANGCLVGCYGE